MEDIIRFLKTNVMGRFMQTEALVYGLEGGTGGRLFRPDELFKFEIFRKLHVF